MVKYLAQTHVINKNNRVGYVNPVLCGSKPQLYWDCWVLPKSGLFSQEEAIFKLASFFLLRCFKCQGFLKHTRKVCIDKSRALKFHSLWLGPRGTQFSILGWCSNKWFTWKVDHQETVLRYSLNSKESAEASVVKENWFSPLCLLN